MESFARRRLTITAALFLAVFVVGTMGYWAIEGWPPLDALYMTVITVTTVGFAEVRALSAAGRVFTMILIVMGVGSVAYVLGSTVEYVVATEFTDGIARRRRRRMIEGLSGHYVICGFGRVGSQAAHEFAAMGVPLVVVDEDAAAVAAATGAGLLAICGDATSDAVLLQAGVERAAGLLTALDSDAENLYVVLSARGLNARLLIVARADQEHSEGKMLRAGANRVLSPALLGGRRMAALALRPNVVQFLDVVTQTEDLELWLEEVEVPADSPFAGSSLQASQVRQRTGATVVALVGPDGALTTNPAPDLAVPPGAKVIALGTRAQLRRFCDLITTGACKLV
ncbi:MAG: potassium channel family protein [Anaerolineae bacterium]